MTTLLPRLALPALLALALIGCGGGSGGPTVASIHLTAAFLSPVVTARPAGSLRAAAVGPGITIDTVVAATVVQQDGGARLSISKFPATSTGFDIRLDQGHTYAVFLMHGTELVAVLRADTTSGMNVFPVAVGAADLDLGTLSLQSDGEGGTVATGELTGAGLYARLHITAGLAASLSQRDRAMLRYATLDVDGDGIADLDQRRLYGLDISWYAAQYQANLLAGGWLPKDPFQLDGYRLRFHLVSPLAVSCDTTTLQLPDPVDYWMVENGTPPPAWHLRQTSFPCLEIGSGAGGRDVNFFLDSGYVAGPPPSGTWTVQAGPSQRFTFTNVRSSLDSTLTGRLVPSVKLTRTGNVVTHVDWQWWVKTEAGFVEATDDNLQLSVIQSSIVLGGMSGLSPDWVSVTIPHVNAAAAGSAEVTGAPASLVSVEVEQSDLFDGGILFTWTMNPNPGPPLPD